MREIQLKGNEPFFCQIFEMVRMLTSSPSYVFPLFVTTADFERVGWINDVLTQIWPSVNSAVSQQFRDLLGPLLRQNKPSWIASLKLFRYTLLLVIVCTISQIESGPEALIYVPSAHASLYNKVPSGCSAQNSRSSRRVRQQY